jgi:hypothetical protein
MWARRLCEGDKERQVGTKNQPGKFDCCANAAPDEPMFVLLGRDPMASFLVEIWAEARAEAGETPAKIQEARECAIKMREWASKLGKGPAIETARDSIYIAAVTMGD